MRGRVAFVSFELAGPDKTGGIGSWVRNSALLLVASGYEVVVYYVLLNNVRLPEVQRAIGPWSERGVALRIIDWPRAWPEHFDLVPWVSQLVLDAVRDERFDVIHFHDVLGLGFAAVMAKRSGTALRQSALCVTLHGCTIWHRGANGFPINIDHQFVARFEAETIRECDCLISPSRYMLEWVERQGYTRKGFGIVVPNVLFQAGEPAGDLGVRRADELVFFGRLEPRKGLDLFCDAVVDAAEALPPATKISFLGKSEGGEAKSLIERVKTATGLTVCVMTDADSDAAQDYLKGPGRVAVIPSRIDNYPYTVLECATRGIPFLAAAVGGIPEMLDSDDVRTHLFAADSASCGRTLLEAVIRGVAPARRSQAAQAADSLFLGLHETLRRRPEPPADPPRATIALFVDPGAQEADLAALIDFAASQTAVDLRFVVGHAAHAERLRNLGYAVDDAQEGSSRSWAGHVNEASRRTACRLGFFVRGRIRAAPHLLATLANAQQAMGADAVVASSGFRGPVGPVAEYTPAATGPTAAALVRNIFGGFALLVDLSVFRDVGGFADSPVLSHFEHWEFLTRLLMLERRIASIPEPVCEWDTGCNGYLLPSSVLDAARWGLAESARPLQQALIFLSQSMPSPLSGLRIVQERIAAALKPIEPGVRLPFSEAHAVVQWGKAIGYHPDHWCGPLFRAKIMALAPTLIEALEVWQPKTLEPLVLGLSCNGESATHAMRAGEVTTIPVGFRLEPGRWFDFQVLASGKFVPGGGDERQLSFVLRKFELRSVTRSAAAPTE